MALRANKEGNFLFSANYARTEHKPGINRMIFLNHCTYYIRNVYYCICTYVPISFFSRHMEKEEQLVSGRE